jgi:alpha-D-xyloside xylohydrolase
MTFRVSRIVVLGLAIVLLGSTVVCAEDNRLVLDRGNGTIVLEPYGPNILRVTLSSLKDKAAAGPGYGFSGAAAATGWSHRQDEQGNDVYASERLVVRISSDHPAERPSLPNFVPLDKLNLSARKKFFGGDDSYSGSPHDTLSIATPQGKALLALQEWSMAPNSSEEEGHAIGNGGNQQTTDRSYRVAATFDSPNDEHYYGLGQNQQGFLDLRDHEIHCWHDYNAPGGQSGCVPFLISSRGYGLIWDNPSKTTIDLGFNQISTWSSEIGDRVSFFVVAGSNSDEIYEGYRQLTGVTHMLPKAAYGYIQSKAIYPTQDELLAVANGYRERRLPVDAFVVDFLNMSKQGQMDLDPARWPDPAAMNRQLHGMGFKTLLSVWPHFAPDTRYFDMLRQKGWLIRHADNTPDFGSLFFPPETIGPNIDTTNPEAARWWWEKIRDNYIRQDGFDWIWLDETEPDIDPYEDYFSIGSGARYYNIYPLFHTAAVYDGFRRDFGDSRRVMSLARASYLGAQHNGTVFWNSDIIGTWDMLKRSIPTGLNFTASGMPYWDTDIAGFYLPERPADYRPPRPPLIDPSEARDIVGNNDDYPELFVRWFEWGVFQPIMRAHGARKHNEVWSYGKQAESILAKYLRLRYQLLPYIYSQAYHSYQTGAPYSRALFMDFPNDPKVSGIPDEYMFGPAFLVAPVTDQGANHREVYLPAGCDWYNFWTDERVAGGQTITVAAPIDTIPLFVRAGSIIPLGSEVANTDQAQAISSIRIYPGASSDFTLYDDDGKTYIYEKEKDAGKITHLHWDEPAHQFTHGGTRAWTVPDKALIRVIGR